MPAKTEMYNWNDLASEEVRPGVTRSGFRGEKVLLVMNRLEPGMDLHPHRHPFEQVLYIVSRRPGPRYYQLFQFQSLGWLAHE